MAKRHSWGSWQRMLYVRVAKAHLDRWLATPMGLGEYHGPLNHQTWEFMWRHLMKTTLSLLLWILDDSAIMVMDMSGIFFEICQEWRIMMYMILSTSMTIHGCLFFYVWYFLEKNMKRCKAVSKCQIGREASGFTDGRSWHLLGREPTLQHTVYMEQRDPAPKSVDIFCMITESSRELSSNT